MPLRQFTSAEAFANLKRSPWSHWPRVDDPDNRFLQFATPEFRTSFRLAPGEKIFTIGSCFARAIETALQARGFDIPTRRFVVDEEEWGGDPAVVLNNYVPPAIAPHIRWAFGLDRYDLARHAVEALPDRWIDMQMPGGFKPMPAEAVLARRERLSAVYREIADCRAIVITLGLVEAWWDAEAGSYVNSTPPGSVRRAHPERFALHVLDYDAVHRSLVELVDLLRQVGRPDHRVILTVSPVPLTATFTGDDVAVANSYSKSVLRAAAEAIVTAYDHIDYFPSFESVLLSERASAFEDDQIHVTRAMVRVNVDRMLRRYVPDAEVTSVAEVIADARAEIKAGHLAVAEARLRTAHAAAPDDADLAYEFGDVLLRSGAETAGEAILAALVRDHAHIRARCRLARHFNTTDRPAEAAAMAETASAGPRPPFAATLERGIAYVRLGRHEEALRVLAAVSGPGPRRPQVMYWRARAADALGRDEEAERAYREATTTTRTPVNDQVIDFADFLSRRGRRDEAAKLVDEVLLRWPLHGGALRRRVALRSGDGTAAGATAAAPRRVGPLRMIREGLRVVARRLIARIRARI